MTRDQLLKALSDLKKKETTAHEDDVWDPELVHMEADRLLLTFINDEEVRKAFQCLHKWYS